MTCAICQRNQIVSQNNIDLRAGQRSTICGPESFTPDKQPLFGETGVKGLLVNCAMNSRGIQFSGGVGREMANLVVDGAPSLDMFAYDIARF